MQTVGSYIKKCRERRGLSLRELGAAVGLSHAAVGYWEQDKTRPAEGYWPTLAETIGADPEVLRMLSTPPEVAALRAEVAALRARLAEIVSVATGARP